MEMTEQQVRAIARDEQNRAGNNETYNVLNIPRHVHNGVDAPVTTQKTLCYTGYIFWDGSQALLTLGPNGWTVRTDGTGAYTVIHNLNTEFYVPMAVAIQSTNAKVITVISPFINETTFAWFDSATQAATDTGFAFYITAITNSVPGYPSYLTVGGL